MEHGPWWQRVVRGRPVGRAGLAACVCAGAALAVGAAPASGAWGFEKVTPSGKGGGAVQNTDFFQVAPDGDALLYSTTAPFEGLPADGSAAYNMYVARRGPSEWSSRSLQPKYTLGSGTSSSGGSIQTVIGTSPNLRWAMVGTPDALAPGAAVNGYNLYRLDTLTGDLTFMVSVPGDKWLILQNYNGGQAGSLVKYFADDGKTIMWTGLPNEVPGITNLSLLRWTEDGGAEAGARLPNGDPALVVGGAGNDSVRGDATRESVPRSQDGVPRFAFSIAGFGFAYFQDGEATRVISRTRLTGSPEVDAPADVRAVSDNGRFTLLVTKTTNARLTDETPLGLTRVLYVYDADQDTLTYVGAQGTDTEAILQMSQDGRTVAFQSSLDLAVGAIAGRQNIYVWRDGTIKFVAAPDANGAASSPALFHRVLSDNGRYLAFSDDSASLAASFGFDNANPRCTIGEAGLGGTPLTGRCMQVYRFDADAASTDALDCVSCRTDGQRPAGASGDPASRQGGGQFLNAHQMRMVADDGTVFFTSADDLIPEDSNGDHDAYAWHDGQLRLLSRAQVGFRSRFVDANADGSTVLISTNDPIVPNDDDRAVDLYVTREGAGYPVPPPAPRDPPCTGTDCRSGAVGALGVSPPFGTGANDVGGGNLQPRTPKATARVTKGSVRGSRLRLTVRVSQAGVIRASGVTVRTTKRTVNGSGTYTLLVPLSKKAQKTLRKSGRVATRTRVSLTPPFGRAAATTYRRTVRK